MAPAIVVHAIGGAVPLQWPHQYLLTQTVFAAVVRISQFAPGVVTNSRSDCVVEEGAVLRDLHIADRVFESAILALDGKDRRPRFARLERRRKVVNTIRQPGIVLGQRCAGNLDVGVIPPVNGIMDFGPGRRIRVRSSSCTRIVMLRFSGKISTQYLLTLPMRGCGSLSNC